MGSWEAGILLKLHKCIPLDMETRFSQSSPIPVPKKDLLKAAVLDTPNLSWLLFESFEMRLSIEQEDPLKEPRQ